MRRLGGMELVVIATYFSITEANVVRARLESEGIEAVVRSDDVGSTVPTMGAARGVAVMVSEGDRPRALDSLERMLPG